MFDKLIQKLCVWADVNLSYSDEREALDQTHYPPGVGASYSTGHIDALLDVLHLMGHSAVAGGGENQAGEIIYDTITVDGINLVANGTVDSEARRKLIATNKEKED